MGHKKRRLVPKPFTKSTGATHRRHHQEECSGSARRNHHHYPKNEEIDMGEITNIVAAGNGATQSKHSNNGANCHHHTSKTSRVNKREMSFYPTSVTEVETYYA